MGNIGSAFVWGSVNFYCYELTMKWSHFQRDMRDICLHILLPARDPNGENHFHEKSESSIEKDPNNPEETIKNIPDCPRWWYALWNVLNPKSSLGHCSLDLVNDLMIPPGYCLGSNPPLFWKACLFKTKRSSIAVG